MCEGGLSRIGRVKMRNKTFQHSAEYENIVKTHEARKKAKQLLEEAKRKVEELIER